MISSIRRTLALPTRRRYIPRARPGDRIYAIGDVHGCYGLLQSLLQRIEQHSRGLPAPDKLHVVLLGDVVDRGPDSAKVLEFLYEWSHATSGQILLMGNHEELMLRAYDAELAVIRPWMRVGGRQTVESFGLAPPGPTTVMSDYARKLKAAIPSEWMEWVRRWPVMAQSGDYVFCHAGVRPGVSLAKQAKADLMWIREEFLSYAGDHGQIVVHGHTISRGVDRQNNRIGIDTGAYATGVLSALYLEDDAVDIIATGDPAVFDKETALPID